MSKTKFKYLVHPLLDKPENCLPGEIYSAFLAAQVEIDLVCKCLDNIKLTMDDLKKACKESSKRLNRSPCMVPLFVDYYTPILRAKW